MRKRFAQFFGSLALIGALGGSTLAAVTEPQVPAKPAPPLSAVPQTAQPKKLTPEQEAALAEVRKILREASEVALSVVVKDPQGKEGKFFQNNKNFVLRDIIAAQARAGDIEGAGLTAATNQWKESEAIAIAYARAGQPHKALKAVDTRYLRPAVVLIIVEALYRLGDRLAPIEVIEGIHSPWDRAKTLFLFARFLAKIKDPLADEIVKRARALSNTLAKDQPWVLVSVAQFQADAGDLSESQRSFQKAREAALLVTDTQQKINSLQMVAKSQVESGDKPGSDQTFSEAIRIARSLTPDRQLSELGRITKVQLEAGDQLGAEKTVQLILQIPAGSSPREQAFGLMRRAGWHLTFGDREAARMAVQAVLSDLKRIAESKATKEQERDFIYSDLAGLAAKAGALDIAQEALVAIKKDERKISAIREVVETLVHAYFSGDATKVIQHLADIAKDLTEGLLAAPNDLTMKNVAVVQAGAGNVNLALQTVDRMKGRQQEFAYTEMIEILIAKKDWLGAHQVASGIREQWLVNESTARFFEKLSRAEAKAGKGVQGLEWARQQPMPLAKGYSLLGAAEGSMDSVGIEPLFPIDRF